MRHADKFFKYAVARHEIYERRRAGEPREKWTRDLIMQEFRFCNVFRELDKTTKWFAANVRDPLRDRPEILLAAVVFRMFNRIEVGEAVFCQLTLEQIGRRPGSTREVTAFDLFLRDSNARHLRRAIRQFVGPKGPYVTGAYIISSPPGYSKLDGVLKILGDFNRNSGWRDVRTDSMREAWKWLRKQPYLGKFHSYEIVTDLRHTEWFLGGRSPRDVTTWANVGPGARRGANRVAGRDVRARASDEQVVEEMKTLLRLSRDGRYWPAQWPSWELREVEHTLCEFDKYERVRLGEGRPRSVYR